MHATNVTCASILLANPVKPIFLVLLLLKDDHTLKMAYHLLTNWKPESTSIDDSHAAVFITTQVNSTRHRQQNNSTNNNAITCYKCGLTGHYANNCPHPCTRENNNTPNGQNSFRTTSSRETHTNKGNVLATSAAHDTDHCEFTLHMQHRIDNDAQEPSREKSNHISMDWILVDNQSTIDIFTN
jgi:hypothetical protein